MSAPGWAWSPAQLARPPPAGRHRRVGAAAAWPRAPAQWQFWRLLAHRRRHRPPPAAVAATASPGASPRRPDEESLVWETWFVMLAFLLPSVMAAVVAFAQHVSGVGQLTRFPVVVAGHPFENMSSGSSPMSRSPPWSHWPCSSWRAPASRPRGSSRPTRWKADVWPALGLIGASFGTEFALLIPLAPLFAHVRPS